MERGKKGQGFFEKEGALFYDDELPTLWFNDDERTATVPILWPDPPGVSADGKEPPPPFREYLAHSLDELPQKNQRQWSRFWLLEPRSIEDNISCSK
jgi:hypothetical protein